MLATQIGVIQTGIVQASERTELEDMRTNREANLVLKLLGFQTLGELDEVLRNLIPKGLMDEYLYLVQDIRNLDALTDRLLEYSTLVAVMCASARWAGMFGHYLCGQRSYADT